MLAGGAAFTAAHALASVALHGGAETAREQSDRLDDRFLRGHCSRSWLSRASGGGRSSSGWIGTAAPRRARRHQERLRFASDLHDIQGHHLQVISLKSELAERLLERDPERARALVHEVRLIAKEALEETRSLVAGYRQVAFDEELENAREVLAASGAVCTLRLGPVPSGHEVQRALGSVVREATTNILRHSEAGSRIRLSPWHPDDLTASSRRSPAPRSSPAAMAAVRPGSPPTAPRSSDGRPATTAAQPARAAALHRAPHRRAGRRRIVGATKLADFDLPNESTHIGLDGYDPRVWGTAVNPEAKLLLLGLAFANGFGRVKIQADAANARSRGAIEKLGRSSTASCGAT
ncbi:GNAT family N-acetyltransferase, partial [Agromyces mediolanus]|uniref:GNAT family N-acetyltransferase n=1 Tax=Agromyces mediolanus TaxID=41986 RepID=UPI003608CF6F